MGGDDRYQWPPHGHHRRNHEHGGLPEFRLRCLAERRRLTATHA
jgi:hypothetical protein